jgi:nucleoside-diphosphate-sugar epimerase
VNLRVYIVGHKGYLGAHLLRHFTELNYSVHPLDLRKPIRQDFVLEKNDIVIDCSRIREFDEVKLREDYVATVNLLGLISKSGAVYARIGSVLELDSPSIQVPYVEWSKKRSNLTLESKDNRQAKLILVPNIYGGDESPSIVDRLLEADANGEEFTLDEPKAKKDFLSMKNFLNGVQEILFEDDSVSHNTTVLTSGYLYEIESISSCIKFQNSKFLLKERAFYSRSGEVKEIADSLLGFS